MEERESTGGRSSSQERVSRIMTQYQHTSFLSVDGISQHLPMSTDTTEGKRRTFASLRVGHFLQKQKVLFEQKQKGGTLAFTKEHDRRFTFSGEPEIVDCDQSTIQDSPSRRQSQRQRNSTGLWGSSKLENSSPKVSDLGNSTEPEPPGSRREESRGGVEQPDSNKPSEDSCKAQELSTISKESKIKRSPPPQIQIFQIDDKYLLPNHSHTPSFQGSQTNLSSSMLTDNSKSRHTSLGQRIESTFGLSDLRMKKKRLPTLCSRKGENDKRVSSRRELEDPCTFGGPKASPPKYKGITVSQFLSKEERPPLKEIKTNTVGMRPSKSRATTYCPQLSTAIKKQLERVLHECKLQSTERNASKITSSLVENIPLPIDSVSVTDIETLKLMIRTLELKKRDKETELVSLTLQVGEVERTIQKAKREIRLGI